MLMFGRRRSHLSQIMWNMLKSTRKLCQIGIWNVTLAIAIITVWTSAHLLLPLRLLVRPVVIGGTGVPCPPNACCASCHSLSKLLWEWHGGRDVLPTQSFCSRGEYMEPSHVDDCFALGVGGNWTPQLWRRGCASHYMCWDSKDNARRCHAILTECRDLRRWHVLCVQQSLQ